MSADRRQELLDLLLGELDAQREEELRGLLREDRELQRELSELESLVGFMRRGEQIEVDPAIRGVVMREAQRMTRPSLGKRLASLPGLFGFRFRRSIVFRVAAVSLAVHLVVVAVLWNFHVRGSAPEWEQQRVILDRPAPSDRPVPDYRPDQGFASRIELARVSRSVRLSRFGVPGQREAIRSGVETLAAQQHFDGSFGSAEATAKAALVLLGEGVNSTDPTTRGRIVRDAMGSLLRAIDGGERNGFVLSALIEDWVFSYENLTEEERTRYVRAMQSLIPTVQGDGAAEALILAELAGLPVRSDHSGELALVLGGSAWDALRGTPSRLRATALIARIQDEGPAAVGFGFETLRDWVAPAFHEALAAARGGDAQALLVLQSPYRL